MHDIDQVQLEEFSQPGVAHQPEYEEEDFLEFEEETLEFEDELSETAELELASQFLEITSEHELEQFLGHLVKAVAGAASDFARSREGRQLTGILKHAAGRVLPVVGQAVGRAAGGAVARATGGPRAHYRKAGARAGRALGTLAKRGFGLELEGMSHEDQEFEIARRFVRFGSQAIRDCLNRVGTGPATQITRQAATAAARRLAPGLITEQVLSAARMPRSSPAAGRPAAAPAKATCSCGKSSELASGGSWERRGNTIVLLPS